MTAVARCILPLSVLLLALAGCSDEPAPTTEDQAEKPVVTVAAVREWDYPSTRQLPGVVRPGKRAVLSTRIAGTLISVTSSPGDRVAAGELLATIDAREIEAAIAAARQNVAAAEAAVRQARLDSQRLESLYQEDLIARVRTERAEVKLSELKAQLQAAQSRLDAQQANLSYTRLTAPFDGLVAETLVDSGSFVGPGQPLLVLEERGQMRIDVPVSDDQADSLIQGQSLSLITGPGEEMLEAQLVSVIPALTETGTGQRLRLAVDPEATELTPGEVVSVVVPAVDPKQQNRDNTWVGLPAEALIRRGQLTGAMVVAPSEKQTPDKSAVIHLRWLKTATTEVKTTNLVPVTQGLEVGELVVLNPSPDLQDGQSVITETAGEADGER